MRYIKNITLAALLLTGAGVWAEYNPSSPSEPGVANPAETKFSFAVVCLPASGGSVGSYSSTYARGSNITLRATAKSGYRFAGWEDEGEIISTSSSYTYVMPGRDVTLTARFIFDPGSPGEPGVPVLPEKPQQGTLYLRCEPSVGGSINVASGKTYDVGTKVSLSLTRASGFIFNGWERDGEIISTSTSFSYTILKGDQEVIARLTYNPGDPTEPGTPVIYRTLTLNQDMAGGTLRGAGTYAVGAEVAVSTTLNNGYGFVNWTDKEGNVVSTEQSFKYTMPNLSSTLTAHYTAPVYNPSSPSEPGASVPPGSSVEIAPDQVVGPRFTMQDIDHLVILCETEGAAIRYMITDDVVEDPSESIGTPYTGPIELLNNVRVAAWASKDGMRISPVRYYNVLSHVVPEVEFRVYKRKLQLSCADPRAVIRYTTDWSTPTETSEIYTEPLDIADNTRVTAIGFIDGLVPSPEGIYPWRLVDVTLASPTFSINSDGQLCLSQREGATISYTLDGSDPTDAANMPSTYAGPIEVGRGMVVSAYAYNDDWYASSVATFVVDNYILPDPQLEISGRTMSINGIPEGATAYYTLDGSLPGRKQAIENPGSCFAYEDPMMLSERCTVKARNCMEGMISSDVVSTEFDTSGMTLQKPTFNPDYDNRSIAIIPMNDGENLALEVQMGEAEPVLYELADDIPPVDATAENSPLKARVIDKTGVRFPSDYVIFEINILPDPEIDITGRTLSLSNIPEGSTAYCSLLGSVDPSPESVTQHPDFCVVYQDPIRLTEEHSDIRVRTYRTGWFTSNEVTGKFNPNNYRLSIPMASMDYSSRIIKVEKHPTDEVDVIIECLFNYEDGSTSVVEVGSGSEIPVEKGMTSMDAKSKDPTGEHFDSWSGHEEIWQLIPPVLEPVYREDGIIFTCGQSLGAVVEMPGVPPVYAEIEVYSRPAEEDETPEIRIYTPGQDDLFEVEPWMKRLRYRCSINYDGVFASGWEETDLRFGEVADINYDGMRLRVYSPDATSILVEGPHHAEEIEREHLDFVPELGVYYFRPRFEDRFSPEMRHVMIEYNYNEEEELVRVGYEGVMGDLLDLVAAYLPEETLHVEGPLNEDDFSLLLQAMYDARYLDLKYVEFPGSVLPAATVYPPMLMRLSLPELTNGSGWLGSLPNLTEVEIEGERHLNADVASYLQPNALVFCSRREDAEREVNVVADGVCDRLVLTPGYPFHSSQPFTAKEALLTREFSMRTPQPGSGEGYGWETIVLPFRCDRIEYKGESIAPFLSEEDSRLRFWLREVNPEGGWKDAAGIEAKTPYIISVPNHPDYLSDLNIEGEVAFLGHETRIEPFETPIPVGTEWNDGSRFMPLWINITPGRLPVGAKRLNVSREMSFDGVDYEPGEAFLPSEEMVPLECIVVDPNAPLRAMSVSGAGSGIPVIKGADDGITVERSGDRLRISSTVAGRVGIYTVSGILVERIDLEPGGIVVSRQLDKGLYIIGRIKVAIN